jgi:DnaK suppressor protein
MRVDPSSGLTEAQVADLRDRLVEMRAELGQRVRHHLAAEQRRLAEIDSEPAGDAADQSGISFDQGLFAGLSGADHQRMQEIDAALERIEGGSYGICEGTGEPIGYPRLNVEPWARYSTEYQAELEFESGRRGSPTL